MCYKTSSQFYWFHDCFFFCWIFLLLFDKFSRIFLFQPNERPKIKCQKVKGKNIQKFKQWCNLLKVFSHEMTILYKKFDKKNQYKDWEREREWVIKLNTFCMWIEQIRNLRLNKKDQIKQKWEWKSKVKTT